MVYFTFGKDSNTSTGSNPPGPNRLCLSISSSFFASSICSLSFSIARFLILVLNASNSSSKALRYSWSAIAILKGGTNKNFCNFHILLITRNYNLLGEKWRDTWSRIHIQLFCQFQKILDTNTLVGDLFHGRAFFLQF